MLKLVLALSAALMALAPAALADEPQATSPEAQQYLDLAQQNRPLTQRQEGMARHYMELNDTDRDQVMKGTMRGFDLSMPWDYIACSVCFYSELAGGGTSDQNIISAGETCHELYLH